MWGSNPPAEFFILVFFSDAPPHSHHPAHSCYEYDQEVTDCHPSTLPLGCYLDIFGYKTTCRKWEGYKNTIQRERG